MNINFKFLTCFHQTQSNSTDPEQTTHSDVQGQFIKIYLEIVLISNNH